MTTQRVVQQAEAISGAALLVKYLEQEGVEYVFAVPGAPLNALFRELHRSSIRTVLAKHEAGAAFMAYGYARVTGRLGVCAGTAGPGTTNLITGAAAALWDGIPMLMITGQVPVKFFGMGALQESTQDSISSVNLMAQVTKLSDMIPSAHLTGRLLRRAIRAAFAGRRGPVAVNIPADVLSGAVNEQPLGVNDYRVSHRGFDRLMLARLADRLKTARMPVILAGNGVVSSGAHVELLRLAEEFALPVATTQSGKGSFPEAHALALGVYGFAGSPRAAEVVREHADLLVVIGSSLGQLQTGNFNPVLSRIPMVHVDVDSQRIGRNFPVEVGLVGDALVVLDELRLQLRNDLSPAVEALRDSRRTLLEQLLPALPFSLREARMRSEAEPLLPQRVIHELQQSLPDDAVVLWDSGSHAIWGLHYFQTAHPLHWVHSGTFAAMGHSIAAAVGARLGHPGGPVICVTGDGCFMMHGLEVATAVNHDAPVIWIVLNNSGMRMVEQGQKALFGEAYLWRFDRVDFVQLARSLGADGVRVERPGQLARALARAMRRGRPTVIDCWIDPAEVPPAFTNANT